ncbi:MAG TPA: hypothetical protein VIJ27_06470 [Mucilaginibacter sp.]
MIKLSLTSAFLFGLSICYGQYRHQLIKDTSGYQHKSFTIIKIDKQPDWKVYNYVINNGDIDSTKIDSVDGSGKKDYFFSFIRLNKGSKLLDINELLTKFHVSTKYYNLPVYIDSAIIYRRENVCFQLSAIKSVKIQKEKYTHLKYISINSIYHINNPIADVYVWGTYTRPKDSN